MSQHLPDGTWIQVGRAELQALQGAKFTGAERQVIDAIWCHQTGIAWSHDTLKAAASVSLGVVRRALRKARSAGLLERYQLPGDRAHRYARPLLGVAVDEGSALGLKGLRNVSGSVYANGSTTGPTCSESVQVPEQSTQGVPDWSTQGVPNQSTQGVPGQSTRLEDSVEDELDDSVDDAKQTTTTTSTTHEHATDTGSRTEQHGGDGFFSPRRRAAISQEVREILDPIQGVTAYPITLRIAAALLKAEGADRLQELVEDVSEVGDSPGGLLTARLRMWEETGELVIDPDSDEIGRMYEAGQERSEETGEHEPKQFSGRRPVVERDESGDLVSVCYVCFVNQDGAETDCSCTSTSDRFSFEDEPGSLLLAHAEWQRRSGCTGLHAALWCSDLDVAKDWYREGKTFGTVYVFGGGLGYTGTDDRDDQVLRLIGDYGPELSEEAAALKGEFDPELSDLGKTCLRLQAEERLRRQNQAEQGSTN